MQVLTRAMLRTMNTVRLVGEGFNDIVPSNVALEKAEAEGMDLVVVSDKSTPWVVRIQDFKKLQYEAKKAKAKQSQRKTELKEIQLKANITDHDLTTKINAITKFLERGDKVKLTVRLKGRERDNPERAHQLIDKVVKVVTQARVTRVPGPIATAILEPTSKQS